MSEFKVGDRVVLVGTGTKDVLLEIVEHMYTPNMHRVKIIATGQYGPVFKNDIRHATPEEIVAGHRIDKPSNSRELETIDEPVGSLQELHPEFAKVLHENFLELLGDDFPIENHISPHCQSRDV
ncbi:TPA: hypothetical protein ACF2EA_002986 [Acinetobacter baumannii]